MIELHPEFLIKNGKKEFAVLTYEEFIKIKEILEDLEDLEDLIQAKEEEKAIEVLLRIETEADLLQNKTFAQANLMKLYYDKKDYANAVVYAEKVLNNPKIEVEVKNDAQIIVARSAMETGDEAKAKAGYEKLISSQGELGAEALYYEAYFKNKAANYKESNASVQQLAKNYSDYKQKV